MRLDPHHAQQIISIHYLPGLRLAYQELGELIQSLEATQPADTAEPATRETDRLIRQGVNTGTHWGRGVPRSGVHWTQTPEGRQRLSVQGRNAWRRKYDQFGTEHLGRGGTNFKPRDNAAFRTPEFREKVRRLRLGRPRGAPGVPEVQPNVQRGTRLDARGHRLPAVHWTQTPEGREQMRRAQEKFLAAHRNDPAWHAKKRAAVQAGWKTRRAKLAKGAQA